jgi:alkylhydroperoxidase family enzyme
VRSVADSSAPDARIEAVRGIPARLLGAEGALNPALRLAAFEHGGGRQGEVTLPEPLARFVDKVATEAYKVVDADVARVRDAGYSEDAVLEAVLATAMGAGLSRLEVGLAALAGQAATA